MKRKLKTLIQTYIVLQIVIACECPPITSYNWEIVQISIRQFPAYNFPLEVYMDVSDSETELSMSNILGEFGSTKANAMMQKCMTEEFLLQTRFKGISITSQSKFSESELIGSELSHHFVFRENSNDTVYSEFEEIMNLKFNKAMFYRDFGFHGQLLNAPTVDSVHVFTYKFYLENGDSLVTVAEPFTFSNN
jgi:hypothetical protein